MKQVIQNYKTGELKVEDVPIPALRPNGVLVRNAYSLTNVGTERANRRWRKRPAAKGQKETRSGQISPG